MRITIKDKKTNKKYTVYLKSIKADNGEIIGQELSGSKKAQDMYMLALEESYLTNGGLVSHGTAT